MKANELRIGDIVSVNNRVIDELFNSYEIVTKTKTFRVASISDDGINLYINEDEIDFGFDDIEPTPLTEEWLVKFGFKKIESHSNNHYRLNNYEICLGNGVVDNGYSIVNEKPIQYVNQLQNLYFALTGEELVCVEPRK